jgi:hypothetical protein
MGFLGMKKPFQKESIDNYQGVLVPLATAQRHPTVAAEYARRRSAEGRSVSAESRAPPNYDAAQKDKDASKSDDGEGGIMRTTSAGYSPYTVEGLRAEVTEEVGAGGSNSAYDCMCTCRLNIQDRLGHSNLLSFSIPKNSLTLRFCEIWWTNGCLVKSKVINKAIQDVGMGRYNWELFVLCGFGWFADK